MGTHTTGIVATKTSNKHNTGGALSKNRTDKKPQQTAAHIWKATHLESLELRKKAQQSHSSAPADTLLTATPAA